MKIIIIIIISISCISLHAQKTYKIDLSNTDVISKTINDGENFKILLENYNPLFKYIISTEKGIIKIPPLSDPLDGSNLNILENSDCGTLKKLIIDLNSDIDEVEINNTKHLIEKEIEKEDVQNKCINQIVMAKILMENTNRFIKEVFKLKKGEKLTVNISRTVSKDSIKEWKHIYKTKKRGEWVTTVGLTFITPLINKEKTYFSKSVDTAFVITKKVGRKKLAYVPSVFFTWFPEKDLNTTFSTALTAGIGYDLESPTAFLGLSIFYNQNVSLVFGLTAHKQDFLLGQYKEDQVINEILEFDSLHESLYTVNPFFSLTYRFKLGSNIAKKLGSENIETND